MNRAHKLEKAHGFLEQKVKATKSKQQQSLRNLDDLTRKLSMLKEAWSSTETVTGQKISALTCWVSNDFIRLVDNVSVLIKHEMKQENGHLTAIEEQLQKEVTQETGLNQLKQEAIQKIKQQQIQQEQEELDDLLQRTPSPRL